jgi:hypothetical protein
VASGHPAATAEKSDEFREADPRAPPEAPADRFAAESTPETASARPTLSIREERLSEPIATESLEPKGALRFPSTIALRQTSSSRDA